MKRHNSELSHCIVSLALPLYRQRFFKFLDDSYPIQIVELAAVIFNMPARPKNETENKPKKIVSKIFQRFC